MTHVLSEAAKAGMTHVLSEAAKAGMTHVLSEAAKAGMTHVLTLNFLVAVVNTLNTKTHSSKELAEFTFENADVKSVCYANRG